MTFIQDGRNGKQCGRTKPREKNGRGVQQKEATKKKKQPFSALSGIAETQALRLGS